MYWVLPEDLEPLADLVEDLAKHRSSRVLNERIYELFLLKQPGFPAPPYTESLDAAISLIPHGWWWHISHLEASVIPNRPEPGIPINNATDYDFGGHPIRYSSHLWGEREGLAKAVCAAMVRARCALLAKVAAKRDSRCYLIQTGNGPKLVDKDGIIKELPAGSWLNREGQLVAHKDVFPQYDFIEPELEAENENDA